MRCMQIINEYYNHLKQNVIYFSLFQEQFSKQEQISPTPSSVFPKCNVGRSLGIS